MSSDPQPEPELPARLRDSIQFVTGQTFPSVADIIASAAPAFVYPFVLQRDADVTGVSGTGVVADGVLWHDGTVALRWRGERPSTVMWGNLDDAVAVHGHDGRTRVVWPSDARRDDGPTTGDDAPTTPVADESGGPRCDHMEPGTPCDWDRCEQPDRLARGDRGGAQPTPTLDALRAGQRVWQTAAAFTLAEPLRADRASGLDPAVIGEAWAAAAQAEILDGGALPLLVATCDASMLGITGKPIGPCVLRHDHPGPVHRAADETTWWPTPDDGPTTAVTEQPTPDDEAVAAELRTIADAIVADAETYPGAGANWHNGIDHAIKAMRARADWMDHRTDGLTPPADGLPPAKPIRWCVLRHDHDRYGCTGPDPQES